MHQPRLSLVARSRDLENLIEKTKAYILGLKSPATLRAYGSDFEDSTRFCRAHNLTSLPSTPETVRSTSPTAPALSLPARSRAASLRSTRPTRPQAAKTRRHQRTTLW